MLCFATPEDTHHENSATGRIGDCYFSVFFTRPHHVCVGLNRAKVLTEVGVLCSLSADWPLCTSTPDNDPRHAVRTPGTVTVHRLERHIPSWLTNDDADVTVTAGTGSSEIADHGYLPSILYWSRLLRILPARNPHQARWLYFSACQTHSPAVCRRQ